MISAIICTFVVLLAAFHPTAANTEDIQKGLKSFASRLTVELGEDYKNENIILSPFCIETTLAMARMGAEGETAAEIDKTLFSSAQKTEDVAEVFHNILLKYQNDASVKMANKIYTAVGHEAQDNFKTLLTKDFNSELGFLNFDDNVAAANTINSWVEDKTNNKIKELISPESLNSDTRLVLVNAIHFSGNWLYQFNKSETTEKLFYLDDKTTTKVEMMYSYNTYNTVDDFNLRFTAIELPYDGSNLSMVLILPFRDNSLSQLERDLKNKTLSDIMKEAYLDEVKLWLPKFKVEFKAELSETLSKMGMERMFNDGAEFGNMLYPYENLKIDKFIHKAVIEVNEKGTEAAAASGGVFVNRISSSQLVFDRPFFYAIKDANDVVLFSGYLRNPTTDTSSSC